MSKNIGFISTRFAGTDGVTLEANKWSEVLEEAGHRCFWFAGELDKDPERRFHVAEGHFQDEQNTRINDKIFGTKSRKASVTKRIHAYLELNGFYLVVMDGFLSKTEVKRVRDILDNPKEREKMADQNYAIVKRHYCCEVLRGKLNFPLTNFVRTEL